MFDDMFIPYTSKYLLRRYLDPPGTHPSPTFSEGTWRPRDYVQP